MTNDEKSKSARAETVQATPAEVAFIRAFTAERCTTLRQRLNVFVKMRQRELLTPRADLRMAAATARAAAVREDVRTPDEEVRFVFAACENTLPNESWRAEVTVPPSATTETPVTVRVTGEALDAARLRLAGCVLPLLGGCAQMPFGLFLNGIGQTDVALTRPDRPAVPGRLLFF